MADIQIAVLPLIGFRWEAGAEDVLALDAQAKGPAFAVLMGVSHGSPPGWRQGRKQRVG